MPGTLDLVRKMWGVPFRIENIFENTSQKSEVECEISAIHRIAQLNTLDFALYDKGRRLFRTRLDQVQGQAEVDWNSDAIFAPEVDRWTGAGFIPGRQGFHQIDSAGLCWLSPDRLARSHFRSPPRTRALSIGLRCRSSDDSTTGIALEIDGHPVRHRNLEGSGQTFTIFTDSIPLSAKLHVLTIKPSYSTAETDAATHGHLHRMPSFALSAAGLFSSANAALSSGPNVGFDPMSQSAE